MHRPSHCTLAHRNLCENATFFVLSKAQDSRKFSARGPAAAVKNAGKSSGIHAIPGGPIDARLPGSSQGLAWWAQGRTDEIRDLRFRRASSSSAFCRCSSHASVWRCIYTDKMSVRSAGSRLPAQNLRLVLRFGHPPGDVEGLSSCEVSCTTFI